MATTIVNSVSYGQSPGPLCAAKSQVAFKSRLHAMCSSRKRRSNERVSSSWPQLLLIQPLTAREIEGLEDKAQVIAAVAIAVPEFEWLSIL